MKKALLFVSLFIAVGVLAGQLPVRTCDNAGNCAAVKAASTPPLATDPALVVTSSPYQFPCIANSTHSIATGGTAQTAAALNTTRQNITLQNYASSTTQGVSTAESLFYSFNGAATLSAGVPVAQVFELLPGQAMTFGGGPVSTQALSVNAVSTGHLYGLCEQ